MNDFSEDQIYAEFDRRVDEGIIVFDKHYRTVPYSDNGFQIEFRVLSGLSRKPGVSNPSTPSIPSTSPSPTPSCSTPSSPTISPSSSSSSPPTPSKSGFRPGSDINIQNFEIASSTTHLLAFNKFSSARPHLLFLTQDGYRRQHEALEIDDFTALWKLMGTFVKKRYMAIFNCGVDSGCSRLHKHMQVFGVEGGFKVWVDGEGEGNGDGNGERVNGAVPFRYFLGRFEGGFPEPEELLRVYRGLLRRAEEALGWDAEGKGKEAAPHNVVLDRKWMLVVPRRASGLNGADANAAAVLGMLWVSDEEKMNRWTEQGPAKVLAHLGVPAEGR